MYSCAQACDSKKATSEKSPFYSCLFSKVTLFILLGVGAIWGRALLILHSKLMNVGSGFLPCYQKGSWVKQTPSLDEHEA